MVRYGRRTPRTREKNRRVERDLQNKQRNEKSRKTWRLPCTIISPPACLMLHFPGQRATTTTSSLHPRNLRAFHRVLAGPTGFCSPLCSSVVLTRKTVGSPPFAVRRFAEKRAFCSSAFLSRHTSASGPVFPGFVIRGSFSRLIIHAIMYLGGHDGQMELSLGRGGINKVSSSKTGEELLRSSGDSGWGIAAECSPSETFCKSSQLLARTDSSSGYRGILYRETENLQAWYTLDRPRPAVFRSIMVVGD